MHDTRLLFAPRIRRKVWERNNVPRNQWPDPFGGKSHRVILDFSPAEWAALDQLPRVFHGAGTTHNNLIRRILGFVWNESLKRGRVNPPPGFEQPLENYPGVDLDFAADFTLPPEQD